MIIRHLENQTSKKNGNSPVDRKNSLSFKLQEKGTTYISYALVRKKINKNVFF